VDRTPEALRARNSASSEQGARATREGRFDEALRWYRRAKAYAVRLGDPDLIDAADLNLSMVRIQSGEAKLGEDGLREILLRTSDDRVAFTAAYNLASSLRRQSRHDKAMAFAGRALERARKLGADDLTASAEMLTGNILLAGSYPDRALEHYRRSLEIRDRLPRDDPYSRAILLENLGYCLLQRRDVDAGIATLRDALVLAREVGDDRCRAECHQDLSFAFLIRDDLDAADRHGTRALELSRARRYADIEENCHYLLGEVCARRGDNRGRDAHFHRLQSLHPELPFLKDFLCAVDVTSIITLKR
jgi:tetratricopeptide (TPR) repeat protein